MSRSVFAEKLDKFLDRIYVYHGSLDSPESVDGQVWGMPGINMSYTWVPDSPG